MTVHAAVMCMTHLGIVKVGEDRKVRVRKVGRLAARAQVGNIGEEWLQMSVGRGRYLWPPGLGRSEFSQACNQASSV